MYILVFQTYYNDLPLNLCYFIIIYSKNISNKKLIRTRNILLLITQIIILDTHIIKIILCYYKHLKFFIFLVLCLKFSFNFFKIDHKA